jgi:hypothetical protein
VEWDYDYACTELEYLEDIPRDQHIGSWDHCLFGSCPCFDLVRANVFALHLNLFFLCSARPYFVTRTLVESFLVQCRACRQASTTSAAGSNRGGAAPSRLLMSKHPRMEHWHHEGVFALSLAIAGPDLHHRPKQLSVRCNNAWELWFDDYPSYHNAPKPVIIFSAFTGHVGGERPRSGGPWRRFRHPGPFLSGDPPPEPPAFSGEADS